MNNARRLLLPFLLSLAAAAASPGAVLRIEGDRLSLQADREPVREVLQAFASQGVRVKLDPAVTGSVTLAAVRLDAEKVLGSMLKDCDYLAVWKSVKGPLGSIPVLEELQVYKPGRKEAVQALAPPSVLSTNRMRLRQYMAGELLLRVKPGAPADQVLALIARYGGRVAGSQPALGLYKIVFPPESDIPRLARELAQDGLIASAEPNYVYRLPADSAQPASLNAEGTLRAASGKAATGGPMVAVLDTGFGLAEDPLVSWMDAVGDSPAPVDLNGHGTQMALLAAGRVQPYSAASPDDPLLPVLSVRMTGQGDFVAGDALLESLQGALAGQVRVISLSWGSEMESQYMKELLAQAAAKGVVVVAASGNEATGQPVYPAAFPSVLAVSAAGLDGKPADWSNYGNFVDLAAPGYAPIPGTASMAVGTSVSTAYAAHVLGLYFQLHPAATAQQAVQAVQAALNPAGWDTRYGAGLLDTGAVQRLLR